MSTPNVDSRNLNKEPFVVNNQVYILGNPIINAHTLDQLVYILDQLGERQPVVIINPEANTVPDFEEKLSNLIQNNRQVQPWNVTTNDKYRFKDMSDADLEEYVKQECARSGQDYSVTLYTYQGLRVRAQRLFALDELCRERDELWAAHCANPDSPDGSARYGQLVGELIPQAQADYDLVVKQLQEWDEYRVAHLEKRVEPPAKEPEPEPTLVQQSSVTETIQHTQLENANVAAVKNEPVDSGIQLVNTGEVEDRAPWGPWLDPAYLKLPITIAKQQVNSGANIPFKRQQQDVEFGGKVWHAVPLYYLLALGIELVADGLPVCYTEYGTFCRVGNSNVPANNLKYWRPQPTLL